MTLAQSHSISKDDLRSADEEILDAFESGRATKGALIDWTGYSRNTVYNRLEVLEAGGLIECVHEGTRLFELIEDPREQDDDELRSDGSGARSANPIDELLDDVVDDQGPYAEANELAIRLVERADEPIMAKTIRDAVGEQCTLEEIALENWWTEHGRPAVKSAGADNRKNVGWMLGR